MIDKIMMGLDGQIELIYTDRGPLKVTGTCPEHSLQLLEELLDWSAHFDMLDTCEEITQIIELKEAV